MFPKTADLVSTKYCISSVMGDVTTERRLIACPARDGKRWCVRSQTRSYDHYGGGEELHPFSYTALIKDAFNHYRDYTLTKGEALSQLAAFDWEHPSMELYSGDETYVRRQMFIDARLMSPS